MTDPERPEAPTTTQEALRTFQPRHSWFVGIDSDGCAFDTMELKHKECFIPNIIRLYGLQSVSRAARQVAEFVNLYSRDRGIHRFPGLVKVHELLAARPEVSRRGVRLADLSALRGFINSGRPLSNPSLERARRETPDPGLDLALSWSEAVNADIAAMVRGVKPFAGVGDCLEALEERADLMVVSATPEAALTSEWEEHDLARYVGRIAGQEAGKKQDILEVARARGDYEPTRVLMVGDAPGDLRAARANGVLFFPIVPGAEEDSWARLRDEGLARFFAGEFAGDYEQTLEREFLARLPVETPW